MNTYRHQTHEAYTSKHLTSDCSYNKQHNKIHELPIDSCFCTRYFACRTIDKVASYLIKEEVAHNFHIIRGARCRPRSQINGFTQEDSNLESVLRVFLWPRNPVHGKECLDDNSKQWLPFSANCWRHVADTLPTVSYYFCNE